MGELDADGRGAPVHPRGSLVDGAERAVHDWLAPGRFREGDRLPTEEQLAAMLGISRGTLRSALRRLERSGEIVRRQGSGTFVGRLEPVAKRAMPWLRADSYTARRRSGAVSAIAMSVEMSPIGRRAAAALEVEPGRRAVQIRRVLAAGEVPVGVSHDVLHPDLRLPGLSTVRETMRGGGTVHAMLVSTVGIWFSHKRTRITALHVEPGDVLGRQLALREPTACVALEDISSADAWAVHYARDVVLSDEVDIEVVQSAGGTRPERLIARDLETSD